MSFYGMLFGQNPNSKILLSILGITKEQTGRFRDIFIGEDGKTIEVYTRNGGGNRECWCDDAFDEEYYTGNTELPDVCKYEGQCSPRANLFMKRHPLYVRDYDDDFDCTYAYFVFKVPEKHQNLIDLLNGEKEPKVSEKFFSLFKEMNNMTPEQFEKDERFIQFKPIFEQIQEMNKNDK